MAITEYDYEPHYDVTDKPRVLGNCDRCEIEIYDDTGYIELGDKYVCLECKYYYDEDDYQ